MSVDTHQIEKQLFDFFEKLEIETTTLRHEAYFTVDQGKDVRGKLTGGMCKSLFLKDKKAQLWLVVALDHRQVDMKTLSKQIGSARLSFGKEELLIEVLGVRAGSVTPFSLINDKDKRVNVVLDKGMLEESHLNYHPLHNQATTTISSGDLLRFLEATGHEPQQVDLEAPTD